MTNRLNQSYSPSTDFVSYIDPELVAIFKKEYGEHFDVVIDMEMKKRTRDIMERHARRYGRSLTQDNSDATMGFYFAYTPFGYLYGQPLSSHKAMEWLTGETSTDNAVELAKSMAAEINFQGENLINNPTDDSLLDSDNSRHTFAQRRKLQISSVIPDKYSEIDKWW
jgi:hypothetical protein